MTNTNKWLEIAKILQSPSVIKYNSSIHSPKPYHTNMNVYHNTTTNQYVLEYPGSGSAWNIVDEVTAKEIIEKSVVDESYSKWVKEHFSLKKD